MAKIDRKRDPGKPPKMCWLPVSSLKVDRNYQRGTIPKHIEKIASGFSWAYFQPPTVCPNVEGEGYWILDGQQRVKAAGLLKKIKEVPCYLVDIPMTKEQAEAFIRINRDRKNVTPVDLYWAGVAAEEKEYLELKEVLDNTGVSVPSVLGPTEPGETNAINAILRCLSRGGRERTEWALRVLNKAYPEKSGVLTGSAISALYILHRDHLSEIGEEDLIEVLSLVDLRGVYYEALEYRQEQGGRTVGAFAKKILELYRRCQRPRKLEIVK